MNMIQAKAIQKQVKESQPTDSQSAPSPSKSVLGNLSKSKVSQDPIPHFSSIQYDINGKKISRKKMFNMKMPTTVEDVPFRRQDRRILNARKKRSIDRSLIKFIICVGTFVLLVGIVMMLLWHFTKGAKWTDPFLITGPVVIGCGIMILLFSVEICCRLKRSLEKVLDPEIDKLENLHEIKHWIAPELVPYGWGQSRETRVGQQRPMPVISSTPACSPSAQPAKEIEVDPSQPKSDSTDEFDIESPHLIMTLEFTDLPVIMDVRSLQLDADTKNLISKDIFDESLRYSNVNRPIFNIDRSPSIDVGPNQIRGDFITEEERISNLFHAKSKPS